MKRIGIALSVLLAAAGLCTAQVRQGTFNQRGMAVQEMRGDGLSAAHPSLPIGTKARITNIANNEDIEVTITRRMQPATDRIIDLSSGAALSLGFESGKGGPVIVRAMNVPTPRPAAVPVPPSEPALPENAAAVTSTVTTDADSLPFNIVINNYITNPEKPKTPEPAVEQAAPEPVIEERPVRKNRFVRTGRYQPVIPARIEPKEPVPPPPPPPVQAVTPEPVVSAAVPAPVETPPKPVAAAPQPPAPAPPEPPLKPETFFPETPLPLELVALVPPPAEPKPPEAAPKQEPLYESPPVSDIRIIPALPDPGDGKVYRLLVGTYFGVDKAFRAYQQLQAAGFEVAQEQAGEMCKVFAANIPASRVYAAAQRLGSLGFQQVWISQ